MKHKNPKKLAGDIVNTLQIPRDLAYRDVVVTIVGSSELYIENYKSILEYEDWGILVQTKKGKIRVEGRNLKIEYYTSEEMKIQGCILHVYHE